MKRMILSAALTAVSIAAPLSAMAQTGRAPVERAEIDDSTFAVGTIGAKEGALPRTLWQGAPPETLAALLDALPRRYAEPAYLDLQRRVLLSPGEGPRGAGNRLAGAKLLAAAQTGFYREAAEIAELSPALRSEPALSKVLAVAALYDGDVPAACARGAGLLEGRAEPFFLKLRFLCYVANGESGAADLTLRLLTDQAVLAPGDERMFTTLTTGGSLGATVSPENAFQYAAAQLLGAEVTLAALGEVPGGVLAAVARDRDASQPLRAAALTRALSHRIIGASEGLQIAGQLSTLSLAEEAVTIASLPAGSIDQQAAIAEALMRADDWSAFEAKAILLSEPMAVARPTEGYAPHGGALALAALAAGEAEAASRWLSALRTDPSTEVPDGLIDAIAAAIEAARGEAEAIAGIRPPLQDDLAAAGTDLAGLVGHALSSAASRSQGAAALSALTGLGIDASGEGGAIREAVVATMLAQSGQEDEVLSAIAAEAAAREAFALLTGRAAEDDGLPRPRLKPSP